MWRTSSKEIRSSFSPLSGVIKVADGAKEKRALIIEAILMDKYNCPHEYMPRSKVHESRVSQK